MRGHTVFGTNSTGASAGIGICLGISVGIGVTLSCRHNILWTSDWILPKYSWMHNWDITKNWLDFGYIDPIFKVTVEEKLEIHGGKFRPGYDVKLHPAVTQKNMCGNVRLPSITFASPPLGLRGATTWVADLGGNHLQTDGLVFQLLWSGGWSLLYKDNGKAYCLSGKHTARVHAQMSLGRQLGHAIP